MKEHGKIIIIVIIVCVSLCILAGILFFCFPWIIFLILLITDDGGKTDNVNKISALVTENQEELQDIVSEILDYEQELRIVIDIEEKTCYDLISHRDADEALFDLENIYRLSEYMDIQDIDAYKDSDVDMVVFKTYSYGLVTSADIKGFFYLEQDLTEDIFEYGCFDPYYVYDYGEITDNWYYFEMMY